MRAGGISLCAAACRWAARIAGTTYFAYIAILAVGEGIPGPLGQPAIIQLGFLGLAVMLAGFLAGWLWELAGGLLSLAGFCLFYAAVAGFASLRMNGFILGMLAPGVLHLASFVLRRRESCPVQP